MARTREFDTDTVVRSAMELFWRRGYEATSIQDLVEATGLGRGSLYAAFGSKDGLYETALRRYVEMSSARMTARLERDVPVRDVIRDLLLSLVDEAARDADRRGCLVTNTAVERLPHDAVSGRIVADALGGVRESIAAALTRARERGELPPDADVPGLADFFITAIQGLRVMAKAGPDRRRLAGVVETALGVLP
ncbi:TetR/AcrR family transcriptional regulator [Actinoallomurus sp. NPDC052274]|uniref:TetR/AcrR family transcriptional regulator n=1 Tax=Actinoallomurus sp. NPDC052274 TaxID=3155420 RepID=UPI00344051B8